MCTPVSRGLTLALALVGAQLAACDLGKTGEQLTAEEVMVGTLLATPSVQVTPGALGGGEALEVPGETAALVFFGTREGSGLEQAPAPISDATVSVGGTSSAGAATAPSVELAATGQGTYARTGAGSGGVQYVSGLRYTFTAERGGERFEGEVEDAPPVERIDALHPSGGFVSHPVATPLPFTRPAPPAGGERAVGFVTVFPLSRTGQRGAPTYTNVPSTPLALLQLVASPGTWKTEQVSVPGSAFPEPGSTYLVVFQAVRMGGAKSSNLFVGSALLAGTADVGVVRTR